MIYYLSSYSFNLCYYLSLIILILDYMLKGALLQNIIIHYNKGENGYDSPIQ